MQARYERLSDSDKRRVDEINESIRSYNGRKFSSFRLDGMTRDLMTPLVGERERILRRANLE